MLSEKLLKSAQIPGNFPKTCSRKFCFHDYFHLNFYFWLNFQFHLTWILTYSVSVYLMSKLSDILPGYNLESTPLSGEELN